jgi:hypothetical protein
LYLALVHHPVRDRAGGIITTSVTNLDVHDLARTARTYDLRRYFLVTPVEAQQALVRHLLGHWNGGPGGERVPERAEALSRVTVVPTLDAACAEVLALEGAAPACWTTAARGGFPVTDFSTARALLAAREGPVVLVLGTGHGLADAVIARASVHLAPVRPGGYNHLPVRAAAAIILDRLLGDEA